MSPEPHLSPPLVLAPDVALTRRLYYHTVLNADGEVVYNARTFTEIVSWLYHQELASLEMEADGERWRLTIEPLEPDEEA